MRIQSRANKTGEHVRAVAITLPKMAVIIDNIYELLPTVWIMGSIGTASHGSPLKISHSLAILPTPPYYWYCAIPLFFNRLETRLYATFAVCFSFAWLLVDASGEARR